MAEKQKAKRQKPQSKKASANTTAELFPGAEPVAAAPAANALDSVSPTSGKLLAAVMEALPDVAFVIDEEGLYVEVYTSPTNYRHLKMDDIKGHTIQELNPTQESIDRHMRVIHEVLETGVTQMIEYDFPNPDGVRWYEGRVSPVRETVGHNRYVVWLAREITHHREAKEELQRYQQQLEALIEERTTELTKANTELIREQESRGMIERMLVERQDYLMKIVDNILAMVYVRSMDNVFTLVSRKYAEFFGLLHNDILGSTPDVIFPADIADLMLENDRRVTESGGMSEMEYWCDINGERKYALERAIPLMDETRGRPLAICGTVVDITENKQREEYITHIALHDNLTGLANRQLVMQRLGVAISQCEKTGLSAALMFIDLDFFKKINDTIGHDAGDTVLMVTAKRFCSCVRKSDTVGRFGGDEFVIVMEGVRSRDDIEEVVKRIFALVGQPIMHLEHECVVGASIGISICPEHGTDIDTLLTCSDDAMYVVKKRGKNSYAYYNPAESHAEQKTSAEQKK